MDQRLGKLNEGGSVDRNVMKSGSGLVWRSGRSVIVEWYGTKNLGLYLMGCEAQFARSDFC
jgi:hypothetical protein